jgi:hypothetical protein
MCSLISKYKEEIDDNEVIFKVANVRRVERRNGGDGSKFRRRGFDVIGIRSGYRSVSFVQVCEVETVVCCSKL